MKLTNIGPNMSLCLVFKFYMGESYKVVLYCSFQVVIF
jgi:hypothetical protein